MTALPYLFARLTRGAGVGLYEPELSALSHLYPRYRHLFPLPCPATDVFLFRVSRAPDVEIVSLRRPIEDILVAL